MPALAVTVSGLNAWGQDHPNTVITDISYAGTVGSVVVNYKEINTLHPSGVNYNTRSEAPNGAFDQE